MALDTSIEQQATLLYEKEVQTYLSENLHLLGGSKLELIQTEYPIKFGKDSGRIDLLAKDSQGDLVVIEVKRGVAGRSAIGQVQSYMGSLMTEFPNQKIRGLLVAMGLDEAARAALLVTQDVSYYEFKTRFDFSQIDAICDNPSDFSLKVSNKTSCIFCKAVGADPILTPGGQFSVGVNTW